MTKPLKIEHINAHATDSRESLVSLCASVLHMSKGETSLLSFYAQQQSGFTPALRRISNEIGVTIRQVERLRDKLIEHGIAKIRLDRLYIDWERIRLFSTLDPSMTSKHAYVAPVKLQKCPYKVYVGTELKRKLSIYSLSELCELLGGMSEDMCRASIQYLKKLHGIK